VVPVTGVSDRGEAALSEQPPDKQPETGIVILYHGCHKNECRTIRSGDLGMNQDSILRYSSGCGERTRRIGPELRTCRAKGALPAKVAVPVEPWACSQF
jgi:hypothetical protein